MDGWMDEWADGHGHGRCWHGHRRGMGMGVGMDGHGGMVAGWFFCGSSGHGQAREKEKIEQPRLALVSLLHWYGAKGVKRERATLQEGWPVSRRSIKTYPSDDLQAPPTASATTTAVDHRRASKWAAK